MNEAWDMEGGLRRCVDINKVLTEKVLIGYVHGLAVFLPLHLDRAKWRIMVASSAMPSTGVVPWVKSGSSQVGSG